MSKRVPPAKPTVKQDELLELLSRQDEAHATAALAKQQKENVDKLGNALVNAIQKQRADVEEGHVSPEITLIKRRVPHYKQETADLALKAGMNPDAYLEQCRNRGERIQYFRLKLRVKT